MKEANFPRKVKEVKFGAWSLNPKRQIIFDGEVERELEPLLFKILCYLIINKDEIITRQDLIDDVWCQHYVDDNAINRAMSELRKVLKSEIQRGLVVKTHYRKGYSFFLEPEIIFYDEKTPPLTSSHSYAKQGADVQQGSIGSKTNLFTLLMILLIFFAVAFFYLYISFYKNNNIGEAGTTSKAIIENVSIVNEKYKEETLSWMPGIYSQMMLSPDNTTVALSFIQKDQQYSALLLKNLNTGQERKIIEANANIFPAGWSVSNDRVIYKLQTKDECELWDVGLSENTDSNYLFECESSQPVNAINLGNDAYIYSKYGYRNRSELSVLVNRNLSTGEEYQISSPNLNSYGDKLLYFIKNKERVVFERKQFNSSELYITDLEGGGQIKLYETKNRIWTINYHEESDSLLWFDNVEGILYQFSLKNNRIEKKVKVNSGSLYSLTYPINQAVILGLVYPFSHNIYKLNLFTLNFERVSKQKSKFVNIVGDKILFFSQNGKLNNLKIYNKEGAIKSRVVNKDYKKFKVSSYSEEAFGISNNGIEILNYKNFSVKEIISLGKSIISANYLQEDNIGYIIQDQNSKNSYSYIYNRKNSKSVLLPVKNAIWFEQLEDNKYIFLNNLDDLIFFDLSTGELKSGTKVNKANYQHSLAVYDNKLYHSTGNIIYEYDFSVGKDVEPRKVYEIDETKYFISDIIFSNFNNSLVMEVFELENNELVRLSLENSY